jgi:RNA polymerase sigma factor (sigma-70 family)
MDEPHLVTERFEEHRAHLRAVASQMLGSASEADDAVQQTWLRATRSDTSGIENIRAWLTTVVARVCLNMLRARKSRREELLEVHVHTPIVSPEDGVDPEHEALLTDSVGLALLVVIDTLPPAQRLAFVLHDMFGVPFGEIAPMVGRSLPATRQLASRARRRVQGEAPAPDPDRARQRAVVDAFFAAARDGDFHALVAVLDPDIKGSATEMQRRQARRRRRNGAGAPVWRTSCRLSEPRSVSVVSTPHRVFEQVASFEVNGCVA